MISKRCLLAMFVVLSCVMFFTTGPAFSTWTPPIVDYSSVATQPNCQALQSYVTGLTDTMFNKPITNVTASWITTDSHGNAIPGFCQVTGWIWPETKFQVTMPTLWNERYQMNGGGGWDGSLSVPSTPNAEGYATSSANGGYMAINWPSSCGSFALEEPYFGEYYGDAGYPKGGAGNYYGSTDPIGSGNPEACQKVEDYGYRFLYETPVLAKKIVTHYYQKAPKKSYYSGGSNGGKEGQISAQKFPWLYDGYFTGYPLGGHLAVTFRGTWDTFQGAGLAKQADPTCVPNPPSVTCPSVYAKYKAALHYKTVYAKCDTIDGLKDGLIDDPRQCKFDAMTDLPACSPAEEAAEGGGGVYSSTCFTLAQRQALKEIYAGPHNSRGMPWYPGQPLSAEWVTASGQVGFSSAIADGMAPCMFANIALDPPQGPNFDITKFNWDKDPIRMQETICHACIGRNCQVYNIHNTLDGITISPQPAFNMGGYEAVYKRGVKILQTHGWSDSLVTPLAASVGLYETTLQTMGVEKTKSFWKVYVVPGAGHGGGGLSAWPTNASVFDAMVDWVENGNEPDALIGYRAANTDANYTAARSRISCPYPEVARWNGSNSSSTVAGITYTGTDNAANFSCVPPVKIEIEPETLNLKSKGVFTASISVPEGYDIRDWNIQGVSCEGANAVSGTIARNTYIAKFNRQDLQNVSTGNAVMLTVKFSFNPTGGMKALTQGTDMVRIIKEGRDRDRDDRGHEGRDR